MEAPVFVLVHSPLVGPSTWEPVAGELIARGVPVVVPRLAGAVDAAPPRWRAVVGAAQAAIAAAEPSEVVLVGHSGAGPLLPAIGEGLTATVVAYVFVDAGVPPVEGAARLAPPELVGFLRALAVDGRLPPWSRWWGPDAMAALVPDHAMREQIEQELPRLPLAYFEEKVPVAPGWSVRPAAYLRLSTLYEDDALMAQARGWAVDRLEAGHLHTVVEAVDVANRILGLLPRLGVIPR